MTMENTVLTREFFNNSVLDYLLSAGLVLGGLLVLWALSWAIKQSQKNHDSGLGSMAGIALGLIRPLAVIGLIYAALTRLTLPQDLEGGIRVGLGLLAAFLVLRLLVAAAGNVLSRYLERRGPEEANRLKPLRAILSLLIWSLGFIFVLDNLGFNISAIVAGLGVSGIAVAIAAQGILGDLFNYFVILIDRPFEVGDFILFGDKMGTVQKVGIKTTRILTLAGEELVVSNSDLTKTQVHNFKKMKRRRIVFTFGVEYSTPKDRLEQLPKTLKSIIDDIPQASFDRCHFARFADSSLDFETVYYVEVPDYAQYMDIQQEINLKLLEACRTLNVEFAFPTRTVHLQQ